MGKFLWMKWGETQARIVGEVAEEGLLTFRERGELQAALREAGVAPRAAPINLKQLLANVEADTAAYHKAAAEASDAELMERALEGAKFLRERRVQEEQI